MEYLAKYKSKNAAYRKEFLTPQKYSSKQSESEKIPNPYFKDKKSITTKPQKNQTIKKQPIISSATHISSKKISYENPAFSPFSYNNPLKILEPFIKSSSNEILPKNQIKNEGGLYLGDYFAAINIDDLKEKNITAVLTMASGLNVSYKNLSEYKINHLIIPALDMESYNIARHFDRTYSFLDSNLSTGANLLVHCAAGISRSATVVIAYIMKKYNMDYPSAYKLVRQKRSCIYPNLGFVKQLKQYGQSLPLKKY